MIHEHLDIDRWTKLFPLAKLRAEARGFVERRHSESPADFDITIEDHVKLMSPGGEIITSPFHLAVVEQLRAEALRDCDFEKVPTDVFVFGKGEPLNRAVTKVGGLPFLPARTEWPIGSSGKPMVFVGQCCFADSKDILPELPSDVLLIFADGVYGDEWCDEKDALHFEWVSSGERDLILRDRVPAQRWDILPCYGVRHRSVDYLNAPDEFENYKQAWCVDIFEGTKIGGTPRFIQGEENVGGRFLCALGSVQPEPEKPFPYVNVEQPFDYWSQDGEKESDRLLMWGDVGSLYLFLQNDGSVQWTIQCY